MEYPDGKIFEGEWKNGKQNGPGKVITADGRTGEGIWENGKRIKDHIDNDNNHIEWEMQIAVFFCWYYHSFSS